MDKSFWQAFFRELGRKLLPGGRDIGESIREAIDLKPFATFRIGSLVIPVTSAMVSMAVAVVLAVILCVWLSRGFRTHRISKRQALAEKIYTGMLSVCRGAGLNETQALRVLPWTLGLGLFIALGNVLAVIKFKPASSNPAVPAVLALFSLVFIIVMGIRLTGVGGFVRSLLSPMGALLPFNLLDYVIKPISLAFRLFGNIFGAFILIEFLTAIVPLVLPSVFGLWFDLGDGLIQGVVFAYLTIIYIGEIVEKAGHPRVAKKAQEVKHG